MTLQETTDALFKALLDAIPGEWMAVHLHIARTRKPGSGDAFKIQVSNPKGRQLDFGPSDKFMSLLGGLTSLGPKGWTTFQLKAKRKRSGGWNVATDFGTEEIAQEEGPEKDDRQADFGLRFLGCGTRLRVHRRPKGGWILTTKRWLFFVPVGTTTTKLGACQRISTYHDLRRGKHIVELEAVGQPSVRLYEGNDGAAREWLVDTLQELLCVPVDQTSVLFRGR